jgi:hypothetical protein
LLNYLGVIPISKEAVMGAKKVTNSNHAHAWSSLPDVSDVSDRLAPEVRAMFFKVGRLLASAGQTSRFALTLLHSHFDLDADELLVEARDSSGKFVTTVLKKDQTRSLDLVARSWMFDAPLGGGKPVMRVITWARAEDMIYPALGATDAALLDKVAAELLRTSDAIGKYGMAIVAEHPKRGMMWSESTCVTERILEQEQVPVVDIRWRRALRTMWTFDKEGRHVITMGCCKQLPANRGHSGLRHPRGITA